MANNTMKTESGDIALPQLLGQRHMRFVALGNAVPNIAAFEIGGLIRNKPEKMQRIAY